MKLPTSQLMEIGERICAIERLFNMRERFSRKDDTLPQRYFGEPTPTVLPVVKGKKISREKFDKILHDYCELHKWDKNGKPPQKRVNELGLGREPSHML